MGQDQSGEQEVSPGKVYSPQLRRLRLTASKEQLSRQLALKFAAKCYTQLELYCFKEVFRSLADTESGLRYWSESTLAQFLQLPDIQVSHVMHQLVTNLGAFPFMNQAPSILDMEALMRVITILTERYKRVLKRGHKDRLRLLFNSLAVFDRRASELVEERPETISGHSPEDALVDSIQGFDIDRAANDGSDDEDDDELALAALDSLDAIEAISLGEKHRTQHSLIPSDNLLKLVEFLLLIASLGPQEKLSTHFGPLSDEKNVEELRRISNAILASFGIEQQPGISYHTFKTVITNSLPHLFDPLSPLFEHFLFEKDFDLSKRKRLSSSAEPSNLPVSPTEESRPQTPPPATPSLLSEPGEILTNYALMQLSFIFSPDTLFNRLIPLYSGAKHGFSMGSFETSVFTWQAPTLLLISGTILPAEPSDSRERTLADSLPPRRLPSSTEVGKRVTYGAYIPVPWKQTNRSCIGNESTFLLQLGPIHDVFRASTVSKNWISYVTPAHSNVHPGINFGTPLAAKGTHSSDAVPLGPVSLFLDDALEFGVFTHVSAGGGSFHPSISPARSRKARRTKSISSNSITEARRRRSGSLLSPVEDSDHVGDWQDRFEIQSLEVWGFGGEKEAERRKRNQEFEEREAKLRRETILGKTGDYEGEKEILRMAGLIGHNQSGGSMG